MIPDHYQALGVRPDAGQKEIREAYLRIMRAHHPDYQPQDEGSADRARAANAAWEVLGDSARRAAYDRLRTTRARQVSEGPGRRVERRGDAAVTRVAYSAERERYRRDVTRGLIKLGIAAFVVGMVMLVAFS